MLEATFTREFPYWRAHLRGTSQPGKTKEEALRNLNATLTLYGGPAAHMPGSYTVMVDYYLDDNVYETCSELLTGSIVAGPDEAPYEAADRFVSEKEEAYNGRYTVTTEDVYAP